MPKIRPCEPRSPSGRRRCASWPTVVNIGLVRQARVALGTLREVVIIDGDANIAPFATLSSAEVQGSGHGVRQAGCLDRLTWLFVSLGTLLFALDGPSSM